MAKTTGPSLKEKKTVSINAYLLGQSNDLIENGDFSSLSDIVATAMNEFFVRRRIGINGEMNSVMTAYLKSADGKALIQSIIQESLTASNQNDKPIVVEHIIE
jgi:Arc/MetJ-type ribon-helix-helix transcriptional regulator